MLQRASSAAPVSDRQERSGRTARPKRMDVWTARYSSEQKEVVEEKLPVLPDRWQLQGGSGSPSVQHVGIKVGDELCWLSQRPDLLRNRDVGVAALAWEASVLLSRIACSHQEMWRSQASKNMPLPTVVELGSGCVPLPTVSVAMSGLSSGACIATDVPAIMPSLRHNVEHAQHHCHCSLTATPLDWRWRIPDDTSSLPQQPLSSGESESEDGYFHSLRLLPFNATDLVLAADFIYPAGVTSEPPSPHQFCAWVHALLANPTEDERRSHHRARNASSSRGVCLAALELRGNDILPAFLNAANDYFRSVQPLDISPILTQNESDNDGDAENSSSSEPSRHIAVYALRP